MREAGLPIEVLTQYIALYAKGNRTLQQRKNLLITERDRLKERIAQMQQTLKRLNYKISVYEQRIVACEKKLLK